MSSSNDLPYTCIFCGGSKKRCNSDCKGECEHPNSHWEKNCIVYSDNIDEKDPIEGVYKGQGYVVTPKGGGYWLAEFRHMFNEWSVNVRDPETQIASYVVCKSCHSDENEKGVKKYRKRKRLEKKIEPSAKRIASSITSAASKTSYIKDLFSTEEEMVIKMDMLKGVIAETLKEQIMSEYKSLGLA